MKKLALLLTLTGTLCAAPASDPPLTSASEIAATKTAAGVPVGPEIFGVFRGRTPCQDLSAQLNAPASEACNKVKCRVILYQDPTTRAPTTYTWAGKTNLTGNWSIVEGTKTDPKATVCQLQLPNPEGFLSLLKVDENILFLLGKDGRPLVGNIEFSYTLNRIVRK